LVEKGVIARYQVTGRQVLVYLRGLDAGKSLTVASAAGTMRCG